MFNRDWRADKTALWVRVVTAVSVVASLGLAAGESPAATRPSVRAQIQDGILQITGTPGADKVALGLKPGNPNALDVDVGDDGTVDFSFDRGTFRAITVQGDASDVTMDLSTIATADINTTGGADMITVNDLTFRARPPDPDRRQRTRQRHPQHQHPRRQRHSLGHLGCVQPDPAHHQPRRR
jgi:hypothetical protein